MGRKVCRGRRKRGSVRDEMRSTMIEGGGGGRRRNVGLKIEVVGMRR